jgi:hypothetical protein
MSLKTLLESGNLFHVYCFSGKTAMAASVGIDSDFAYVKIVSSLSFQFSYLLYSQV